MHCGGDAVHCGGAVVHGRGDAVHSVCCTVADLGGFRGSDWLLQYIFFGQKNAICSCTQTHPPPPRSPHKKSRFAPALCGGDAVRCGGDAVRCMWR